MKKTTRKARKALSVFLAVLMMVMTWTVAVPGLTLAADTYYVRVYLNIYDGANSDGYGSPYTVVTDPASEFYGKPDDYKWDYGSSWSITDNSKGYDGEVNMAGFTLFYGDNKYVAYDLNDDLVAATTTLGNNYTSMDDLTLDNFDKCTNMVSKVYPFEVDGFPTSLFWINDENNAVNGETGFAVHKITVAESSSGEEHVIWSGLSGSESYYECYYGTITPMGLITPWDDCPDEAACSFYKEYTTSAVGTWIDVFNAGDYNVYPVNNYISGGVSSSFTVGNSGSVTDVDYIDVSNSNNYYINFTNHSTQTATITAINNSGYLTGYSNGITLSSGDTKSFRIDKGSMSGDGGYYNFAFSYTLDNVFNSDGTTLTPFYQANGIGTWNTSDDSSEVGTPSSSEANKGFTVFNNSDIDVMNQFAADIGIFETVSTTNNRTDNVSFEYNYWLDNSNNYTDWSQIGFRLFTKRWDDYKIHLQSSGTTGTINLIGDIANTGSTSLSMADLVTTYSSASDSFNRPDVSNRPWAYYNSPCTPYWEGVDEHKWGTLYNANTDSIFRFCGNIFQGSTSSANPGKIVFNNMTWVCPSAWFGGTTRYAYFSGTINVYVFNKTQLRNYVRNLGGLGANWAPMKNRFNADKWNAYESALETAMRVLANQKTNQKAVTDAYNNLYNAAEALKASANLINQVAEVTYTQYAKDYDSDVVQTTNKYIIMPVGTVTAVPAYDTYKYATTDTVIGKQTSNLTTNYTQYDTGINPIDYYYWKIDVTGVEDALTKATALLNTPLETYSDSYYEKIQDARTALAAFDRDADTWTPTHQSDIDNAFSALNELLVHDSTDAANHQFVEDGNGNYTIFFDEDSHWYECEVCGYKFADTAHTLDHSYTEGAETHTVFCTYADTSSGVACGYSVAQDHNWNDGEVTVTPGCDNSGVKTYTCEDCGATKTESVTAEGHSYSVTDLGDGTHINKCSKCGANAVDAVAEAHINTYTVNADGTHTVECSVCGATETVSHTFTNAVLTRPTESDGVWTDGYYTYTCICGATKTETAERADYSELEAAVAELEALKENENLTDDAEAEIDLALAKFVALGNDLVVAEQLQIDDLVKELEDVKADVEKAIEEAKTTSPITEATSGIGVQFLKKTGVDTVESVQLGANGGFDTVRMRLSNHNRDLPITVTKVIADKAYIGADDTAASAIFETATVISENESADLYVVAPADFAQEGNITYTITYKVGSADTGYLKNADGNAVEFTTKAYLYVKAAAYAPYHLMDERAAWPLTATSKWQHYVEAMNYGDFALISNITASKFSDKLEVGTTNFGFAHTAYDYDEDGCQAGCKDGDYATGDGHVATYAFYVDTSLAPTWEDAGFRVRFTETAASVYENAPLKYVRVANDQAYLDGIDGNDKTFTVTFIPSETSNVPNKTWSITSSGSLEVSAYNNPDQGEYLFGEHKNNDSFEETSAYANFAGKIPSGVTEAKFMFSPRIEFNGKTSAESVTMTTHIWLTSYDKAALREAVVNAETAGHNPGYYDAEKYEAYEEALANAKEVLGKAETNQSEVDTATAALNAAIADLTAAESEAKFVLTVTHSIRENKDKNSEATSEEYDYYLVNGEVTPALNDAVIALDTINKYDAVTTLNVTADAEHTYNYWYIAYTGIADAVDAADAIINDTTTGYSDDYKKAVEEAKSKLEEIQATEADSTTVPVSQDEVDAAIEAVTALTGHRCDEDVEISAKAPTCEDDGLTAGAKCSVCGKITKAQAIDPKLGHTPGEATEENRNDATCEQAGSYESVVYCSVCDEQLSRNTVTLEKLPHTEEIISAVPATCTDTGLTEGKKCSVCEEILVAQTETDALGHVFDATVVKNDATCLADGNVAYKQCKECSLYFSADAQTDATDGKSDTASFVLGQIDHSFTGEYKWNNAGETKYHSRKCVNGCNEYSTEEECTFETVTVDPTCTVGGTLTHTCTVCNNSYQTFTVANGHTWGAWNLTTAPTAEAEGTYTRTCSVCDAKETKSVAREDYSAYDAAIERAKDILTDETLTDAAKTEIQAALAQADTLDKNLPADVVEDGNTIIDNTSDVTIAEATDALTEVLDKIDNDTTGAYEKVDYTNYDNAVTAYEDLTDVMSDADKAAVEEIKAEIAEIPADGSKADYQAQVDKAAADIVAINAKYADCATGNHTWGEPVLTTAPTADEQGEYTEICGTCGETQITKVDRADYEAFNDAVDALEELLGTENLTDEAKTAIEEAIGKAESLDKNLPADVATADGKVIEGGQDEIDALVTELEKVVADTNGSITDGSALKPDYEVWEEAETAYDELDKTNVKNEIIDEVNALKTEIAEKQSDDTLTQSTATQDEIDEAASRLNEVIAGINDGSLKDPDYSAVEDKLTQAKDAEDLNKDTLDKIDAVEEALEEIKGKTDPEANARDDQATVDALEDQLDEILNSIADGTATAPDYTEWDAAEGAYDALDKTNAPEYLTEEATELKNTIDNLKADDTANAAEDQQTIDDAVARLNEIIDEITDIVNEKPDFTGYDASHDAYEELVQQYGNKIKDSVAEIVTDLDAIVEGVRNDETATKTEDQDTIDDAKAQLDAIIEGINDSSLIKDADFTGVDEDLTDAKNKAENNDVIDGVKEDIGDIEEAIDELRNDPETNVMDQPVIDELEGQLEDIIEGIKDGTLVKPDYTGAEAVIENAENTGSLTDNDKAALEELKEALDEIRNDPASNKKDDQTAVDGIKNAVQDIIDKYADCENGNHNWSAPELTKVPTADEQGEYTEICGTCGETQITKVDRADYSEFDTVVVQLENLLGTENLTEEAKTALEEALRKAENLDKNLPADVATVDGKVIEGGQDTIDALVTELEKVVADISDGIADGTLVKPDYTEVDKDLADAKDKVENNDLLDGIKEAVEDIESNLNALKEDPATNKAEHQDDVDELEKELEDIIEGIEDGSLVKPDYTDVDEAIEEAENTAVISGDDKQALEELKDKLDEIKNDSDSNKKDDQTAVDEIKEAVQTIIDKYAGCAGGNHSYEIVTVDPTCTEEGYEIYTCTVCSKSYKDNYVPTIAHVEIILEGVEPTCSSTGLTEGKQCTVCNRITVKQQTISALSHTDEDEDGTCDVCGESGFFGDCVCLCHNRHWFWRIVYLIIKTIWRFFKIHQVCVCGDIHF